MKRKSDSNACRDGEFKTPATPGDVDWMTNAGTDDCRITAASAPLWALVEAHRILKARANSKTRSNIVSAAMKRRFGVVAGSDEALTAKGGTES